MTSDSAQADTPPMARAFVIATPAPLQDALTSAISGAFDVRASTDPREIKAYAADGAIDVVVLSENLAQPSAAALASALRPALPGCLFVLVTRRVVTLEDDAPFDAAIRYPVHDRIFASNVRRALRTARARAFDPRAMQAEIELAVLGLDDKSHYEVLGVASDAPTDEITRAYDALSLRFHPDKLRRLDPESRERGMELYIRITQSYRALRTASARMRYDHALAGGETQAEGPTGPTAFQDWSQVPSARKYLGLAQRAHIARDASMTLAHLRFALTQDPDNALIRTKLAELEIANG